MISAVISNVAKWPLVRCDDEVKHVFMWHAVRYNVL